MKMIKINLESWRKIIFLRWSVSIIFLLLSL